MEHKAYSHSLKNMKRINVFECSVQKIDKMKEEIQRSATINVKQKQKQIKDYVEVRKELIKYKSSKNKLQQEVDKILKDFVEKEIFQVNNRKIKHRNNQGRYRIWTQPPEKSNKSEKVLFKKEKDEQGVAVQKWGLKQDRLPAIGVQEVIQRSKTRRLKTEYELVQGLNKNRKDELFEYVNIDAAIRQYRAGITSLVSGTYLNHHNPYKKGLK